MNQIIDGLLARIAKYRWHMIAASNCLLPKLKAPKQIRRKDHLTYALMLPAISAQNYCIRSDLFKIGDCLEQNRLCVGKEIYRA
jgi:hypothetical protein